MKNPFLYQGLV